MKKMMTGGMLMVLATTMCLALTIIKTSVDDEVWPLRHSVQRGEMTAADMLLKMETLAKRYRHLAEEAPKTFDKHGGEIPSPDAQRCMDMLQWLERFGGGHSRQLFADMTTSTDREIRISAIALHIATTGIVDSFPLIEAIMKNPLCNARERVHIYRTFDNTKWSSIPLADRDRIYDFWQERILAEDGDMLNAFIHTLLSYPPRSRNSARHQKLAEHVSREYLEFLKTPEIQAMDGYKYAEEFRYLWRIGYSAFPIYYKTFEEKFGNILLMGYAVRGFWLADGQNLASAGDKEALEWTRKLVAARMPPGRSDEFNYLAWKGDARDVELFSAVNAQKDAMELLTARVAGTNVVYGHPSPILRVTPSVANTGPQGVYVNAIIQRAWENVRERDEGWQERGGDVSKIPPELLTMVVSFDADGNPVCNVDLAKYGLSMPVIEPKPTVNDIIFGFPNNSHTVTFPPP